MDKATHIGTIETVLSHNIEWDERSRKIRAAYADGSFGEWFGDYTKERLERLQWVMKVVKRKYMVNK